LGWLRGAIGVFAEVRCRVYAILAEGGMN
jgi:hypothetical protein